eukprot:scaffold195820_cov30-Tisochrysis_lutea.AAC.6
MRLLPFCRGSYSRARVSLIGRQGGHLSVHLHAHIHDVRSSMLAPSSARASVAGRRGKGE